jgi:exopolyphosphatase/guanosine-5'-triphosphate,3'-diphosphate pyrophosphatase
MEIHENGQWEQIKKFRAPLRLGTDVFEHKTLQPETVVELVEVFKKIAKINKKHQVQKTIALATSAMRDAKNKKTVVSLIFKTSKIKLKIISGQEEARLIRNAILKSRSNHFDNALLIDIGGGSAELTGLYHDKIIFSKSYPLGVVRLLSIKNKNKNVREHCESHLNKIKNGRHHFDVAVGTGGNFDAIARLKLSLLKRAPQTHLEKSELLKIQALWKKLNYDQKIALGLRPDRIDVLDLAMDLILMIIKRFEITKIKIPMTGLKEGSIHDLLA